MVRSSTDSLSSPLRLRFSFLLPLLCAGVALICAAARAVEIAPRNGAATLPLFDENQRVVQGVVCDNLPGTPVAQASAAFSELPDGWRAGDVEYSLCNPDGSRTDRLGNPNVGRLEWLADGRRLRYYPPLEFNFQQMPDEKSVMRPPLPITAARRRIVRLTIFDKATQGRLLTATRDIVLRRPTVVLVHGINSGPSVWFGTHHEGLGATLAANNFPLVALDNSGISSEDMPRGNPPSGKPLIYFEGNGPVEFFAENLGRLIASCLLRTREEGFVAHRVDIVAHSYGSLVARWFLRTCGGSAPGSRHWYVNSSNDPRGANLYTLPDWFWNGEPPPGETASTPPAPGGAPVRKLITIAGIWRGVPLCNYLNEIRGPAHERALGGRRFYDAPLDGYLRHLAPTVGRFVDRRLEKQLPTRVPSMEVMAVNSRWMRFLNERPFSDGVAYGSVAGDDSRTISVGKIIDLDPYTTISHYQQPSWFPDLGRERFNKGAHNISDGVVPLWSAALAGSSEIVSSHHTAILRDEATGTYVLAALSSGMLPAGDRLNALWDGAVVSRVWDGREERFRFWDFDAGAMAPEPQNSDYRLVEPDGVLATGEANAASAAVARIAPRALAPLPPQQPGATTEKPLSGSS